MAESWKARTRAAIAARIAADIPEGWAVNLGIGIPTLIAEHVPQEREVVIHSENGLLGMGPAPAPAAVDAWLINAGKEYVTIRTGGAYVHHADSFALIRGGHLDLCVLGAYQVSAMGDLANWARSANDTAPAVGGAMDLAVGAKRVWVAMSHTTRDGTPRIVADCSYPLTAQRCVRRIYTDLAVLDVTDAGLAVREMIAGMDMATLQSRTEARLLPDN